VNVTSVVASNGELDDTSRPEHTKVDPIADPEALIVIKEDQQVLATNKMGLLRINFQVHSRVSKERKMLNSVSLSSLLYTISQATLTLCTKSVNSSAVKELSRYQSCLRSVKHAPGRFWMRANLS
jgi:hypothetical protein